MLIHYKNNNAIHCEIDDIRIAWMLSHCKNNTTHHKTQDICIYVYMYIYIAWMLSHCKNNAIHYRINDRCTAWMLSHCKNNASNCKSKDIFIA